jgi:site-specific DNA-methyltransferase (adenine-specific)
VAAERLKRRWIGIDITHLAINLMVHRLKDSFGYELSDFVVEGVPKDLESARALAEDVDRHHFEWWALSLVGARPAQDKKRGADTGIDGVLYFYDDESGTPKKGVVQVKSGHVKSGDIRDFKSVIEREKAAVGLFITLEPPTEPMTKEAATAGFYEPEHFQGRGVPKLQILTIEELLGGHRPELPRFAPSATFKKAPKKISEDKKQGLF